MAHRLFVGGLNYATTTDQLRELFEQAGGVESATVVTERETGRSRGFGFVEMTTADDADKAIARFNGTDLDGRRLSVERAKAPAAGGGGRGGFGRGGSRGGRRW
jgi:cold-inducible RNA-binding protein